MSRYFIDAELTSMIGTYQDDIFELEVFLMDQSKLKFFSQSCIIFNIFLETKYLFLKIYFFHYLHFAIFRLIYFNVQYYLLYQHALFFSE
jgi:hypothetical protein